MRGILGTFIVIFRPLKVEIHQSSVSIDGFHLKSIILSNNPKILNNYLIFTVPSAYITVVVICND